MRGSDEVQDILHRVLRGSSADQIEALFLGHDTQLTRFANNHVHQNVSERNAQLVIRAVVGGRLGSATTNDLSAESIKRTTQTATNAALAQDLSSEFPGLSPRAEAASPDVFDPAAASLGPAQRADGARIFCEAAERSGMIAAGLYSNAELEMALANSEGAELYHKRTEVEANAVYQDGDSSGYAGRTATRLADIDPAAVADEALDRARAARNPQEIPPGRYEVVLDTYAVHDIANFLALLGFGARAVQERRSFMAGKIGERVMSPSISLWDDGTDPSGLATPFDYEGTPKRRVELVTGGVARGIVYDRATAAKEGRESTGHALPPGLALGPVPLNLYLGAGDRSREELIGAVERGILVTRFWYTRTVHPLSVLITGMTRDGTYLIEDGKVTRPVRNLRFTTSYLDALNDVRGVGQETALGRSWVGSTRVPALHLGSFNFTGVTRF